MINNSDGEPQEPANISENAPSTSTLEPDRALVRHEWTKWTETPDFETDGATDDQKEQETAEPHLNEDTLELLHSTEVGTARAFADFFRDDLIFCLEQEKWYFRQGRIYSPIDATIMQGLSMRFMEATAKQIGPGKTSASLQRRARISSAPALARSLLPMSLEFFDNNADALGTHTGDVLNLLTGAIDEHAHEIITKRIGTHFDGSVQCPLWIQFLDRVLNGDREKIRFLQRAIGYTLTGHTDEQCLFVLMGSGANGKSLILNTLSKLFGDYAATTPMQSLSVQKHEQTNDLAHLVGKRFVSASEGEDGQRLAEAKIKRMTGGDLISCRHLYRSFFTYKPQFKLWLATNSAPMIKGVDEGIWRRIRIIRFPTTIPIAERDPKLDQKLEAELPGILNWALEGLAEWRKYGLQTPASVLGDTESYRFDQDPVEQWISARCKRDSASVETASRLYADFQQWSHEDGHQISRVTFGKTLAHKGYQAVKRNAGNAWRGLTLSR